MGENDLFNKHATYRDMAKKLMETGLNPENLEEFSA